MGAGDQSPADGFYLHSGPGALIFDTHAKVSAAGVNVPDAAVRIAPDVTLVTEVGYQRGNLGVSLTVGVPPRATVDGRRSLEPAGTIGRIRYGPSTLTVHYHIGGLGRFRPYLGGGPVFLFIFHDGDGFVQDLKAHDHIGVAAQAGAEYGLSPHWALFFDAKKAALKTNVRASYDAIPLRASIRLNPTVLSGGLSYHF